MKSGMSSLRICEVLREHGVISDAKFLDGSRLAGRYPDWSQLQPQLVRRWGLPSSTGRILEGRFICLQKLSSGGQGTCYFVFDMKARLPRVLKRLRDPSDDDARQRMQREAYVGMRLAPFRHPSIVQTVEPPDEQGRFIVFEHIDFRGSQSALPGSRVSCDIHAFVKSGQTLSPAETIRFAAQTACALQRMEASGCVHRDVKPSNILISRPRQRESRPFNSAVLTDFGLARILPEVLQTIPDWEDAFGKTQLGVRPMTRYYAPPEQIFTNEVDNRADLYGLGAAMHFMLTTRPPRTGAEFKEFFDVASKGMLPAPCQLSISQKISQELSQILSKLLASHPDQRYACHDDLIEELLKCPEASRGLPDEIAYTRLLCQQSMLDSFNIE